MHQADGGLAYLVQCAVRIEGNLCRSTLESALQNVLQAHEILRTRYIRPDKAAPPDQVILDGAPLSLRDHQLHGCDAPQFATRCDELLRDAARQPFDLSAGPLVRFSLVSNAADEHALLITAPALSMDAPGIHNLVKEICRAYDAGGGDEPRDQEILQYADLAEWKNELLEGRETAAGRAYWQGLSATAVRETKLPPFQRAIADPAVYAPEFAPLAPAPDLVRRIIAAADRDGVPVPALLLAVWQVLLGRLAGQSEIIIGTAFDGRNHEDLSDSLGLFEKYVPLRFRCDENLRFDEVVERISESLERAAKRQDYFSWEGMPQSGVRDAEPFCPLAFDFAHHRPVTTGTGLAFRIASVRAVTDRSTIRLSCTQSDASISAGLYFDPHCHAAGDIQRLGAQYCSLLDRALRRPDRPIADLPVISEQERREIARWNDAARIDFPQDSCLHELIEQRVADAPDSIAVVSDSMQVTYAELNARANQLAHYLRDHGVDRETLVGICVDRSVEMVVALLAIAKAGGAYLPMDPAYPPERLQYMLDDSQVSVMLTQQHLADLIPETSAAIVLVDAETATFQRYPSTNPCSGVTFANLSYVIYTSGSTGKPKGVMLNHRGRVNNFLDFNRRFSIGQRDRLIALASLSFDMCAYDMFGTLAAGATIVIPRPEEMQEPQAWAERINRHMVSTWHTAPAMLQMLVDHLESRPGQAPSSLRLALLGGDWIPVTLPDRLRTLVASAQVISMGGATECSMDSTIYEIDAVDPGWKSIPYGEPMKNQRSYVLDRDFDESPYGVPGELYLGGIGVGRGYFRRPEFTAERFVPDPYVDQPGARMYRTGDLAQWMPDGNLELLGRMDHQVKIRGYRIELGEIESVLRQHDAVREVVVVARDDERGDKMLVAYLVAHRHSPELVQQLRARAKERLPEYMVPSACVVLESLPLTPNGKVDRRSLPAPEPMRPDLEVAFVAPRTETEAKLAEIWADVLHMERVGTEDSFFELGGHSLLATQVISRVRAAFDVELPLRSLFESPTVAGLAQRIESAGRSVQALPVPEKAVVRDDGPIPLSFAQERLWFLHQLDPESHAYNVGAAAHLSGPIALAATEQSLGEVVRRHHALRTMFPSEDGQPRQVVAGSLPGPRLVDLTGIAAAERDAVAQRLATEELQRPFDLARGPLLRTLVLRVDDHEHVLVVCMHHIVTDGWSEAIFGRELGVLYEALLHGRPTPMPPMALQYVDYAIWQRHTTTKGQLDAQLDYWKDQLAGVAPLLELPTDRPRPAEQTFRGAGKTFFLTKQLSDSLKELCQREQVTPFILLLAGFQTLLHRYSGQRDILVGSPIAGRPPGKTEELIGFFVNTLVLRGDFGGNPSFSAYLKKLRDVALDGYAHQDVPFEFVVDKVRPHRDLSYAPLFQVMFAMQNASLTDFLKLSNLAVRPLSAERGSSKCDLVLEMLESEQGFRGHLEYATDLFDESTIDRMLRHFVILFEAIATNPDQPVSELPLLSEQEREQQLVEWNATGVEYPRAASIHERFEARVERHPDAVAVVFQDQQLTYGELNARANQLARHLRSLGIDRESTVGICMDRSPELLVAILGTLKAGGVYVPMDPDYPQQRLAFMVKDAEASLVLTSRELGARFAELPVEVICLDRDWPAVCQQNARDLCGHSGPDALAYVIYTSGSTGVPKGAEVPHRGVLRLLFGTEYVDLDERQVIPHLSSPSFDASTFEIWAPLLHGGCCVLCPERVPAPRELGEFIERHRVTTMWLTASLFNTVIDEAPGILSGVRQLLIGGEALSPGHVHRAEQALPSTAIINGYGPTESTTFTCCHRIRQRALDGKRSIPIGRPIGNTQVYVVDRQLQPVPPGIAGELYIGGDGLARGYLRRPAQTADVFVPNPFGRQPGTRIYKTGDRVRWLPDQTIDFLERVDHQVKIRGFRIELGEIEAILSRHDAVRQVVVLAREYQPGEKRLVAYIVARHEPAPTVSDLRNFLSEQVPNYMIPSTFVVLDSLPLNASGKIDRRALPMPDQARPDLQTDFVAPRTHEESILGRIWSDVLGVERLGVHDNFFELGGDSILGIQIIARANQAGLQLTPKELFLHQTVSELAAVSRASDCVSAEQGPVTGAAPLTPIQRWFFARQLPDVHHFNQAILLKCRQPLVHSLLEKSVEAILSHHDALRMRYVNNGEGWVQTAQPPDSAVPLCSVDLSHLPHSEQAAALERATADLQKSLQLEDGPLVRVALCDLGAERPQRLFLVIHHLVVDGVSWRILLEDLETAYGQLSRGEPVQLPRKTTSFVHWARRLEQYAQSAALEEEASFWTSGQPSRIHSLPVDFDGGDNSGASSRSVTVTLNADRTEALLKHVPEVYHTQINDVLLTALVQGFSSWTGRNSLLLDLEGHGRETISESIDISRTVGWFTTIYPVQLETRKSASPGDALKAIKEQLRRIPGRGLGYGLLRYLKQPGPLSDPLSKHRPAEVSFNYLGQFDQSLSGDSRFSWAEESTGPAHSARNRRSHLLGVDGYIRDGRLHLVFAYSENIHQRSTIERLAQNVIEALHTLISHCGSPDAGGFTPSDFPLAGLDAKQLSRLASKIATTDGRRQN